MSEFCYDDKPKLPSNLYIKSYIREVIFNQLIKLLSCTWNRLILVLHRSHCTGQLSDQVGTGCNYKRLKDCLQWQNPCLILNQRKVPDQNLFMVLPVSSRGSDLLRFHCSVYMFSSILSSCWEFWCLSFIVFILGPKTVFFWAPVFKWVSAFSHTFKPNCCEWIFSFSDTL